jgi:hypothetical protein
MIVAGSQSLFKRKESVVRTIATRDVAKLIRKRVKDLFPGIRFSVRSKAYSGGSSITVSWTDGPTEAEVSPAVKAYEGADFDGMVDLKTYKRGVISHPDGSIEEIQYGADFVFVRRSISPSRKEALKQWLEAETCLPFEGEKVYPFTIYQGDGDLVSTEHGERGDALLRMRASWISWSS